VIREVGLRDGLQSIARVLPTGSKLEWLHDAYIAGQREMELGSFVPPERLPQLADTAEVLRFARILPGLRTSVLVPNLRGAEGALDGEADLMLVPLSASHAHSLANQRRTPDEMVAEIGRIRALRDAQGSRTRIEVCISMAFGCSIQGTVAPSEVLRLLAAALDAGADVAGLADSVGYADPLMVRSLFEAALRVAGERLCCGHFHDTRGLALANVFAALELGIRRFDASLGGIGGCPYAPGATGNVATEDLAYMLASLGIDSGQDFDALLALRRKLATWLDGEALHGRLWRAGLPRTMVPEPHP
jgi:hydroxymethylglutaryl-CoA lyase